MVRGSGEEGREARPPRTPGSLTEGHSCLGKAAVTSPPLGPSWAQRPGTGSA